MAHPFQPLTSILYERRVPHSFAFCAKGWDAKPDASPLCRCHLEAAESLASPRTGNEGTVVLFSRQMPANSKTVRRSRQFPARAPGMAASACWIRSYCFASLSSAGLLRGFFRSSGAGFGLVSVPRLARLRKNACFQTAECSEALAPSKISGQRVAFFDRRSPLSDFFIPLPVLTSVAFAGDSARSPLIGTSTPPGVVLEVSSAASPPLL